MGENQETGLAGMLEDVRRRIAAGELSAADTLRDTAPADATGESSAVLALAHFLRADYAAAAEQYAAALAAQPRNAEWSEMLARASANAVSEISVFVPPVEYYDRAQLLANAVVPPDALPSPPPGRPRTAFAKARTVAGSALGTAITLTVEGIILVVGRVGGYKDRVWTNWYRRPQFLGVLTLGYMRTLLNRDNLKNTYPLGSLIGFQRRGLTPPLGVTHFRTADGTWNNLNNPKEGAAGTRFPRNVRMESIRPETGEQLLTPNPREVSRRLLARHGETMEVPFLNMLAASWINFQNHDWISHGQNLSDEVHRIPLAKDDPARLRYHQNELVVGKTQPDPTRRNDNEPAPITFINEVTHWWDGSQIYGSDQDTVDHLRSHLNGKLRMNDDGTLPLGSDGVEESGFVRDWWIGLSMLHTLFALEHNAICDALKAANPSWDDNRLFNVARLINAAVTAKIHWSNGLPRSCPTPR